MDKLHSKTGFVVEKSERKVSLVWLCAEDFKMDKGMKESKGQLVVTLRTTLHILQPC